MHISLSLTRDTTTCTLVHGVATQTPACRCQSLRRDLDSANIAYEDRDADLQRAESNLATATAELESLRTSATELEEQWSNASVSL